MRTVSAQQSLGGRISRWCKGFQHWDITSCLHLSNTLGPLWFRDLRTKCGLTLARSLADKGWTWKLSRPKSIRCFSTLVMLHAACANLWRLLRGIQWLRHSHPKAGLVRVSRKEHDWWKVIFSIIQSPFKFSISKDSYSTFFCALFVLFGLGSKVSDVFPQYSTTLPQDSGSRDTKEGKGGKKKNAKGIGHDFQKKNCDLWWMKCYLKFLDEGSMLLG